MPTVRMAFSPNAAHVRTARLVGVAVARRAGVPDATLDEVRLAVGEACSRAVALHRRHGLTDLVEVEITDDNHFVVRVTDRAPVEPSGGSSLPSALHGPAALRGSSALNALHGRGEAEPFPADADAIEALSEEDVAVGVGLTLLTGLVEDLVVRPAATGSGTEVRMSWGGGPRR